MYRIRLATGEEAVYRTVQELAAAVASGMVSPNAEVYHKAANRWLPINTHPDYRAAMVTGQQTAINPAISIPKSPTPAQGSPAVELPKPPATETPKAPSGKSPSLAVGPLPTTKTPPKDPAVPPRQSTVKTTAIEDFDLLDPMPLPPEPPKPSTRISAAIPVRPADGDTAKASAIIIPPIDLPPEAEMIDLTAPEPPVVAEVPIALPPVAAPARQPWLDRGKLVLIASIAALVFAVGITGLIVLKSRPRSPVAVDSTSQAAAVLPEDTTPRPVDSSLSLKPVPPPAATPVRPRPVPAPESYPAPSRPLPASVAPVRRDTTPRAPVTPPPSKPKPAATASKTPSYFQAYADARSEMDESLAYVNFRRVFSPGRFTSMDSLRATKRMVVAAGNILRVYRGREVMLEQQYRPDDPGGRNSLREPFETSEASRALLSDVDSLFALLVNQDGEITVSDREVRFRSSRSARAYNDIRREIVQTLATWRDSAEASNRVTMPRLVQALGTATPPIAR
jgi:hypothetical protein